MLFLQHPTDDDDNGDDDDIMTLKEGDASNCGIYLPNENNVSVKFSKLRNVIDCIYTV